MQLLDDTHVDPFTLTDVPKTHEVCRYTLDTPQWGINKSILQSQ